MAVLAATRLVLEYAARPTRRYYLDRPAVNGADDRGGALILGAAWGLGGPRVAAARGSGRSPV